MHWLNALRLNTLPLAILSILVGTCLAAKTSTVSYLTLFLSLITAILLQILSNLANDYGDALKGTDNDARIGPKRVMQQGLISAHAMKKAISITVFLSLLSGVALILTALNKHQDILGFSLLGLGAILAAMGYTLGNKPYGYLGLGDLFVFIFFGILGVSGSNYLQTGEFQGIYLLPAAAIGLLATGVLSINNLRDIENDAACGKKTLAVRLGLKRAKYYHLTLLMTSFLLFSLFTGITEPSWLNWLFLLCLPLAYQDAKAIKQADSPHAFIPQMANIIKLTLSTGGLFCLGLILSPIIAELSLNNPG